MKAIILGTGSPEGHPILLHPDEFVENNESRLRPSVLICDDDYVLLDTGPDIRQQLLHLKVKFLTAIFITHQHFDHLWGIADIAQLGWLGRVKTKIFVSKDTLIYIKKYMPWINLNFKLFTYEKKYNFKRFHIIPKKVLHSKKFETAAFEIKSIDSSEKILYAPDFKGFADKKNYNNRYKFIIVDGSYFFGKYIKDSDHLGKKSLINLLKKIKTEKYYLIGISPWWYKNYTTMLTKKLPSGFYIPKDFWELDF
jgi:Cft2 family RNA processing exonuclease